MKTRVAERQEGRVLILWRPLDLGDLPASVVVGHLETPEVYKLHVSFETSRCCRHACEAAHARLRMRGCTCRSLVAFQLDRTRSSGPKIPTASMTFEPTQDSCCTF
jgi:hypothetical protein